MTTIQAIKRSGYFAIVSGCVFFLIAMFGKHPASYGFFGVAIAFIVAGSNTLRKAKRG